MKEKDAIVDSDKQRIVLFVEKDDGSYGSVQTGAYMYKNYGDDFEEKVRHAEAACREKLTRGEISPIGYYMLFQDLINNSLPAGEVAARVGVGRGAVKKHMTPGPFAALSNELLQRYADVFGVTVEQLRNPPPFGPPPQAKK